jgi:hypothetical protein
MRTMKLLLNTKGLTYGHREKHFRDDTFNNSGILFFNCFNRPNYSGEFMSETREPYKWYWAYTSTAVDGVTHVFETLEQARDHAIANGEFDEICGKDQFVEHDENLIFEVREDELEDYAPILFDGNKLPQWYRDLKINYEKEAVCNDCGEDIEECHYKNKEGQSVHVTTSTIGHYYSDGTSRCESCHEASR